MRQAEKFETFEHLCSVFEWEDKRVMLVNIYRLPYSSKHPCTIKMFLKEFELLVSSLLTEEGCIMFCGDFNIDWKLQKTSNVKNFQFWRQCDVMMILL